MMFLNRIYTICMFILLMTYNPNSYKWRREELRNNTSFTLNSSPLRRLVEPLSYEIYLDTISKDYKFIGCVAIFFIIEYPTMQINLNAYGLSTKEENIYFYSYPYKDNYNIATLSYQKESLTLGFKTEIPSGLYTMQMAYIGSVTENEVGLYRTICKDSSGAPRWNFMTQLKPTAARVFPCWDDPVFRTRFVIEIQQNQNYISLSNMPIREEQYLNNYLMKTTFSSTAPIPAYLVAFALMDVCYTEKKNNFTIHVCSTSFVRKQKIQFIRNITEDVIAYMHLYMGMSPQLRQVTHIGLPDFSYESAGYWGFNIYRENHLMYNETLHPIERKLDVWMYVSSMVALQWVGNLVSPTSWTHMWFSQTLALFYGVKIFNKYNDKDMTSLFTYRLQSLARENNAISQVKPVIYPANNPDEIDRLIKSSHFINCLKEYAIIEMLEYTVTESIFQRAIKTYLNKYKFSTATPNEFWDILQDMIEKEESLHDHPSIAQVVQSWLKQRSLPVITVTRNHTNYFDYIDIEPSHSGTEDDNNTDNLWIPLNIKTSSQEDVSKLIWLNSTNRPFIFRPVFDDELVIVNWQNTGYYRIKYDAPSVKILRRYLKSDERTKINVLNRAHIIEDAYYFWTEGEFHFNGFLNLINFMSNEEECAPWYALQNIMKKMRPILSIDVELPVTAPIIFFRDLLKKVGYKEYHNDTECVKFKRLLAMKWTCRLFDHQCLGVAKWRLINHLKDPEKHIILPIWKEWTYCNGIAFSDKSIWNEVLEKYKETGNKEILIYLTCSENINIICKYFKLAILDNTLIDTFGLKPEDLQNIYRSIVRKHISKIGVLDCILKMIEEKDIVDEFLENLSYIIENLYSTAQIDKISLFIEDHIDAKSDFYNTLMLKRSYQILYIQKLLELANYIEKSKEKNN